MKQNTLVEIIEEQTGRALWEVCLLYTSDAADD